MLLLVHAKGCKFMKADNNLLQLEFLQPICLPLSEDDNQAWTDSKFTTAGWGKVSGESGLNYLLLNALKFRNFAV